VFICGYKFRARDNVIKPGTLRTLRNLENSQSI